MKKNLVIYHGNCADGFGAAWVMRKYFTDIGGVTHADFHPGIYNQKPPDVAGKHVYIVDFSYPRAIIIGMLEVAASVTIIDHHKSAIEDLADLTHVNFHPHFNEDHSGAMLCWMHFYSQTPAPEFLKVIEDRDLWRFVLENTKQRMLEIFSYPYDFEVWDKLANAKMESLDLAGAAIERKHFKDIHEMIDDSKEYVVLGDYKVPVVNCPKFYGSDLCSLLTEDGTEYFAAYYWRDQYGMYNFGLRSNVKVGMDVQSIAKSYGGGGHPHAAGFRIDQVAFDSLAFESKQQPK